MLFPKTLSTLILLVILAPFSHAQDINVYTDEWEGYTSRDGSGYYLDIINTIYPAPDYTVKINFVPFARSLEMVNTGKADIVLGVYKGDIDEKLISSKQYVEIDEVDLLAHKSFAKTWQGLTSLTNKRVVAKIGFDFNNVIEQPMKYSETTSLVGMMKMLKAKRTDAVIDYRADIKKSWEKADMNDDYVIINAIVTNETFFGFSAQSGKLRSRFESELQVLIKSGKLREIAKKHQLSESNIPK